MMNLLGHVGPAPEGAVPGLMHLLTEPDHLLVILAGAILAGLLIWRSATLKRRRRSGA